MKPHCEVEVILSPKEILLLPGRDLSETTCVVFDILRATSTFVTALAHGAAAVIPVPDMAAAVQMKRQWPQALLAGEVGGLRITAEMSGGVEFDLGNSPREFRREIVAGRTVISSTTNGTRALSACKGAHAVLAAGWLNLSATCDHLVHEATERLLLVCGGTGEAVALEDTLAAGHLCWMLAERQPTIRLQDSAILAREAWLGCRADLSGTVSEATNARSLLGLKELAADVAYCLELDRHPLVASMDKEGALRALPVARLNE